MKQHSKYKHVEHIKSYTIKKYKYAPNYTINARVTASFMLSLIEVGLTPYSLQRNM